MTLRGGLNVLVLDDESAIRDSISFFLEDFGIRVHSAETVEKARSILETVSIDVAIVDLRLIGSSGEDFILSSLQSHPSVKYIIHTGLNDYQLHESLAAHPNVSNTIFQKPLQEMEELYLEVLRMADADRSGES